MTFANKAVWVTSHVVCTKPLLMKWYFEMVLHYLVTLLSL